MSDNPKTPPVFNISQYDTWKVRVELWTKFTDIDRSKRAFVIASACVSEIPEIIKNILASHDAELSKADGLEFLIKQLDSYFLKSVEQTAFDKFVDLCSLKREGPSNTADYVSSFRTKFKSVTAENLNVESIFSLLVLANGNFSNQEKALLKSVLLKDGGLKDLKVDSTCEVIKDLLVDSTGTGSANDPIVVSNVSSGSANYTRHYGKGKGKRKGKYGAKNDHRQSQSSRQSYGHTSFGKSHGKGHTSGKSKNYGYHDYRSSFPDNH